MQRRTFIISLLIQSFLFCLILTTNTLWAQEETRKHVVQALDNYYSLSLKYDVSISDLRNANPNITSPEPGDILIIPVQGSVKEELGAKDCARLKKNRHETYRIALMIPLFLEQVADTAWTESLEPSKINEISPFRFIQFYHGFMMAADSLRQEGLDVEINVYDVDQQTSKVLKVLQEPDLKKMDLIFGPFFKSTFSLVAEFALENKIHLINPLSPHPDILRGNPYVFKLLPSVESQPALLAELVRRDFPNHRIIFYIANKFQNNELIEQFRQALEGDDMAGKQKVKFVDYAAESTQGFIDHASMVEPNLVIIYAENEALPAALLSKLSALKKDYPITVIGLPEWEKFSNIESNYLKALNAHIFMSSYIDYQSEKVKAFIQAYRARYFDEPLNYAFSGFDAGYFFLGAILYYGNDFEKCLNETGIPLIQNQFHFERKEDGGYDNINWNILQYYEYSLLKK
jgi:ABC-type branched-subunit amino acid transport system substrate-binding protein